MDISRGIMTMRSHRVSIKTGVISAILASVLVIDVITVTHGLRDPLTAGYLMVTIFGNPVVPFVLGISTGYLIWGEGDQTVDDRAGKK
jgi:hypothetical protein